MTWLYPAGTQSQHTWSSPRKAHGKYTPAHEDFRVDKAHDAFGSLESKTRVDRNFKGVNPKTCNRLDLCLGPAYLYIKARRARRGGSLTISRTPPHTHLHARLHLRTPVTFGSAIIKSRQAGVGFSLWGLNLGKPRVPVFLVC